MERIQLTLNDMSSGEKDIPRDERGNPLILFYHLSFQDRPEVII